MGSICRYPVLGGCIAPQERESKNSVRSNDLLALAISRFDEVTASPSRNAGSSPGKIPQVATTSLFLVM